MKQIKIIVFGTPVPQGSMKAFLPKGWKRPIVTADNKKTKPWRQEIAGAADEAMQICKLPVAEGMGIAVNCYFYFDRPKSLKKKFLRKITRPDVDKLARAVLDAMTGVVYKDDSQVVILSMSKQFDTRPRAEIEVLFLGLD